MKIFYKFLSNILKPKIEKKKIQLKSLSLF